MGITRVLVANRGEIARRVFATCRRLGLSTVAVYTDPDADAPHVAEADARVRLPQVNSYLDAEALIAAHRLYTDATQVMRVAVAGPFDPASAASGVKRSIPWT